MLTEHGGVHAHHRRVGDRVEARAVSGGALEAVRRGTVEFDASMASPPASPAGAATADAATGLKWSPAARDRWIGRSADALAADIRRVVRDHRFPVLPGVRVHGPAPHVPPMAADRVADDREARYSVRPVAARTHVGKEHTGHGHRGAGRAPAGSTSGRRCAAGTVMVPALEYGWREALHHMDRRPAGTPAGPCDGAGDMGRAGREYGRSGHTDGRVRRRIAGMGRAWMDGMGGDPPVILPTGAGRKAARRRTLG